MVEISEQKRHKKKHKTYTIKLLQNKKQNSVYIKEEQQQNFKFFFKPENIIPFQKSNRVEKLKIQLSLLIIMVLICTIALLFSQYNEERRELNQYMEMKTAKIQNQGSTSQGEGNVESKQSPELEENKLQDKLSKIKINLQVQQQKEIAHKIQTSKPYFVQQKMNDKLKETIKAIRYHDIHTYISDDHNKMEPAIVKLAAQPKDKVRQQLIIQHTEKELESIIKQMKNPPYRPQKLPRNKRLKSFPPEIVDLGFFYNEINVSPHKKEYKQAEFYRFDKLYNIGKFEKQLPLCVLLVGKNNAKDVEKLYDSIKRQNYTNYRIVHVDDNSNDGTVESVVNFINRNPILNEKVTLISQPYQRNSLYNHDFGMIYCGENEIVLDMDADDWLIGSQVFQLVNTLYQTGNYYKGKYEQLWSAYFSFLQYPKTFKQTFPMARIIGQVSEKQIKQQTYRASGKWRTTHLRTYLRKLYDKIDKNDFIDPLQKEISGAYHVKRPDAFIQDAILELSAPKHMKVLDEFVYFYTGSPEPKQPLYIYYSIQSAQTLVPYLPLSSLSDTPKRNPKYKIPQPILKKLKMHTQQMKAKNEKDQKLIREMLSKLQ